MTKQTLDPDVRLLASEKLGEAEFPGGKGQPFRIFFEPAVHDEIWKHSQADTSVEICGVLVGQWRRDENGPFAVISASIRGHAAANKLAEVTFTHETWAKINAEMDSKYADRAIVGWYHTHPDFGIFLSDRDLFIHEHFFSSPGQMAMVVDPIREIEGIFVWRGGKTALIDHYWIGDQIQAGVPPKSEPPAKGISRDGRAPLAQSAAGQPPQGDSGSAALDRDALFNLSRSWVAAIQYLLVFLIGWLLAGRYNEADLLRKGAEAKALAYFQYGMRPDLDKQLDAIRANLQAVDGAAAALEKDHLEWLAKSNAEDKTEQALKRREAWDKVHLALVDFKTRLDLVELNYCLPPAERDLLDQLRARQNAANEERIAKEEAEAKAKAKAAAKPPATTDKPAATSTTKGAAAEGPKPAPPDHK